MLDRWSRQRFGVAYDALNSSAQAGAARASCSGRSARTATIAATRALVVDEARAAAFEAERGVLRRRVRAAGATEFAIPAGTLTDPARARQLTAFFFWSSWAAVDEPSRRHRHLYEQLAARAAGRQPADRGGGRLDRREHPPAARRHRPAWRSATRRREPEAPTPAPLSDPLLDATSTPSQRATLKYFWTVSALALLQIVMGVITAHYGVEGNGFFGFRIDDILPYTVTRTWHMQLGIFWIATAWLAAGLYIAPAVGGAEPKCQRAGVNVLFGALVLVVVGSMAGEWLSVKQMLPGEAWFWFGHSGYEYIDLGRVWQIALLVGLVPLAVPHDARRFCRRSAATTISGRS